MKYYPPQQTNTRNKYAKISIFEIRIIKNKKDELKLPYMLKQIAKQSMLLNKQLYAFVFRELNIYTRIDIF